MSLLFDRNLSRRLVRMLAIEYPGSEHVDEVGLGTADDQTVWAYAAARGLAIVSKDADFRHLALLRGPPPKVVWLRVGNGPTAVAATLLRDREPDVRTFLADPALALLILP
jgi:predicted nuclease of predicted toxin-antitoxin system